MALSWQKPYACHHQGDVQNYHRQQEQDCRRTLPLGKAPSSSRLPLRGTQREASEPTSHLPWGGGEPSLTTARRQPRPPNTDEALRLSSPSWPGEWLRWAGQALRQLFVSRPAAPSIRRTKDDNGRLGTAAPRLGQPEGLMPLSWENGPNASRLFVWAR